MREGRNIFQMLASKPIGRPKYGWEDNIRVDI
jgi:hypothetical protein